jgi:hypothetical protein
MTQINLKISQIWNSESQGKFFSVPSRDQPFFKDKIDDSFIGQRVEGLPQAPLKG